MSFDVRSLLATLNAAYEHCPSESTYEAMGDLIMCLEADLQDEVRAERVRNAVFPGEVPWPVDEQCGFPRILSALRGWKGRS